MESKENKETNNVRSHDTNDQDSNLESNELSSSLSITRKHEKLNEASHSLHDRFHHAINNFFYKVGFYCATNPYRVIFVSILVASILGLGTFKMENVTDPQSLWSPQDSKATQAQSVLDNFYEFILPPIGPSFIFVVGENDPTILQQITTKESLLKLSELLQVVEKTYINENGNNLTLFDVCIRRNVDNYSFCSINSVLDMFWDSTLYNSTSNLLNPDSFYETIQRKLESMESHEIDFMMSQDKYFNTWNGAHIPKSSHVSFREDKDSGDLHVQAYRVNILLLFGSHIKQESLFDWEKQLERDLDMYHLNLDKNIFNIYLFSIVNVREALSTAVTKDIALIVLGVFIAILYITSTLGTFLHPVKSRIGLSMAALLSVTLAIIATFGVGSLISFYGPVHFSLPLLMIVVGIDDAFVIISAYDKVKDSNCSTQHRIACAVSKAGKSISITSFTNACAYLAATLSKTPAIRSFSWWAAIGIIFDLIFQVTFFIACLSLDAQRQEKQNCDVVLCIKADESFHHTNTNIFGVKDGCLERFFASLSQYITLPIYREILLLFACGLFSVSAYWVSLLEVKFDISYLFFKGSPPAQFDEVEAKYFFQRPPLPHIVFNGDLDYTNQSVQDALVQIYLPYNGLITSNQHYMKDSLDSWYLALKEFNDLSAEEAIIGNQFYPKLSTFLQSTNGTYYKNFLIFDQDSSDPKLIAAISSFALNPLENINEGIDMMQSLRRSIDASGLSDTFVYNQEFIYFEGYLLIEDEVVTSMIVCFAAIFIIAVILIGNIRLSFALLLGVCLSVVDLTGFVKVLDINLNTVSVVCLSLGIGMSIDFSAHIALAYSESTGNRKDRAQSAIRDLAPPLVHSSLSTLFSLTPLSFAGGYVLQTVFKTFVLTICLGSFHGLIIVPIVLSLIGMDSVNAPNSSTQSEVQGSIIPSSIENQM